MVVRRCPSPCEGAVSMEFSNLSIGGITEWKSNEAGADGGELLTCGGGLAEVGAVPYLSSYSYS